MPGMLKADHSSAAVVVPVSSCASFSSLLTSSPRPRRQSQSPQRDGEDSSSPSSTSAQLGSEERGLWIIRLLFSCANAVASNNLEYTNLFLEQLSAVASPSGDPIQRVASYFMEALAARIIKCWPGVYKAMQCARQPSAVDLQSAHKIFFNFCPFLKFAFLTVIQSIMDAMEGEKVVHLVDLEACDVVQWLALLQAFSSRAEGPPHLRITVVSQCKNVLQQMAQRLSQEAEKLDIPFQFHPVVGRLKDLEVDMLGVKIGEAVAVSSVMQLHSLLAHEDDHCSTVGVIEKVLSSQFVEENGRGLRGESQGRGSIIMGGGGPFEKADNGIGQGGSHLLQPQLNDSRACTKRSRDCFEADHREVRKHETTTDVEDCSGFCSPSSTAENGDPGVDPVDPEERELTSEAIHSSRNVFHLFEKHGAGLQNGISSNESPSTEYKSTVDRVLHVLRSLYPKVMVVVEQETNHNGATLVERFVEALHYYSAMFDSMDSILPQLNAERIVLERHLFGQEIKNIVACEGLERVKRHEKLESWRKRMQKSGFVPMRLSSTTMLQAERLLGNYPCDGYRLVENEGCLTLCWHDTPLFASSAWQV